MQAIQTTQLVKRYNYYYRDQKENGKCKIWNDI